MNLAVFVLSQVAMAAGFFALGLAVCNAIYTSNLTNRCKRHISDDGRSHGSGRAHNANNQ